MSPSHPAKHLRGRGCRFTIIPPEGTPRPGGGAPYSGKSPQGKAWAKEGGSNYAEDDPKLQEAISRGWGHGLVCGSGGVIVFDGDDAERLQELGILPKIPPTVQVESRPGHRHHHLLCPALQKKFVIYDPILTEEKVDEKTGKVTIQRVHLGEVLGPGGHAVLPGSIHPSGSVYHLVEDAPQEMAEITLDQLKEILRGLEFSPDPDKHVTFEETAGIKTSRERLEEIEAASRRAKAKKGTGHSPLSDQLDVKRVLDAYSWTPKRTEGAEAKGPAPGHRSESGDCFQVNLKTGRWHCKQCEAGGDLASLVAVLEGIIQCTGHDDLRDREIFGKVLAACEERGLTEGRPLQKKESLTEEEEGGEKEKRGPSIATQLVNLAIGAGATFWKTAEGDAFITIPADGAHIENHPLKSKAVKQWLSELLFNEKKKVPKGSAVSDAITVLEGKAVFGQTTHPVFTRLADYNGAIYLDLGDDSWRAVEIDTDGWRVIPSEKVPVKFRRAKGILPLPAPAPGGSLEALRRVLNVPEGAPWALTQAWLIQTFRPTGPYPPLIVDGEQGSGKSWLGRILRYLVDPNKSPLRRPPRNEHELMIAATNSWLVVYDNLSGLPKWLGDALCVVSTGGGMSTRELYTDSEEALFDIQRPMILNGIDELTTRDDLLGRAILLHMPRIAEAERKTEKEIMAELDKIRPQVLGAVLDVISCGLRELPNVELPSKPRMADFAEWVTACERALGWTPGEFLAAFNKNQDEAKIALIDNDMFATSLVEFVSGALEGGNLEISSGLLLTTLEERSNITPRNRPDGWPRSPRGVSGKVRRFAPALRAVGIEVSEMPRKTNKRGFVFKKGATNRHETGPNRHNRHKKPADSDGYDANDGSFTIVDPRGEEKRREKEGEGGEDMGSKYTKLPSQPSQPSQHNGSDMTVMTVDPLSMTVERPQGGGGENGPKTGKIDRPTPEPGVRDPTSEEAALLQETAVRLVKNYLEISAPQLSKIVYDQEKVFIPITTVERWLELTGWVRTGQRLNGGEGWRPSAGVVQ